MQEIRVPSLIRQKIPHVAKQLGPCFCCCQVASVMSNSVRPHRRQPTRLRSPWDSPGTSTGVGCHFLLQCMKVKRESEVAQSCLTLRDPMGCSPPAHAPQLLSLCSRAQESQLMKPARPRAHATRGHCSEKPEHRNYRAAPTRHS